MTEPPFEFRYPYLWDAVAPVAEEETVKVLFVERDADACVCSGLVLLGLAFVACVGLVGACARRPALAAPAVVVKADESSC